MSAERAPDMLMRIRTVKPSFFKHRRLYLLEERTGLHARLAYEGLWGLCDRLGRFEWKPEEIKLDVLPWDPDDMGDVLHALASELFVVQYVVGGRVYGWVPTFVEHQQINARERRSDLPEPPRAVVAWYQRATMAQFGGEPFEEPNPLVEGPRAPASVVRYNGTLEGGHVSDSDNNTIQDPSRVIDPSVTRDPLVSDTSVTRRDAPSLPVLGKSSSAAAQQQEEIPLGGIEDSADPTARARKDAGLPARRGGSQHALPAIRGKRDVEAIVRRLVDTLGEVVDGQRPPLERDQWRRLAAEFVFACHAKWYHKDRAYLVENDKREQRIVARLKENRDDVNQLLYALEGARKVPNLMGQNSTGTVYDGIETLLRDAAQVQKLSDLVPDYRNGKLHPMLVRYAPVLLGLGAPEELRRRLGQQPPPPPPPDGHPNGDHPL